MTYNEIKEKVGDAWALIANPKISEKTGKLLDGKLLFFHKNKKTVNNFALKDNHKHITVRYFGEISNNEIFILNIR